MGKKRPQLRKLPTAKKSKTDSSSQDEAKSKKPSASKKPVESSSDEDDEEDDSDDESDAEINLDKQVELTSDEYTFEFNDIKDDYFLGVRTILSTFISVLNVSSEITECICNQGTVGTVVNNEGEQDAFAFATILPLANIKKLVFTKELEKSFNTTKSSNAYSQEVLSSFQHVEDNKVGFLFHGRFTNLPIQLIYEIHRNLFEDIRWAQQYKRSTGSHSSANADGNDGDDDGVDLNEIKQFQSIESLFFIANCSFTEDVKPSTLKTFDSVLGWNNLIFHNFEDEHYFQEADVAIIGQKHDFYKASSGSSAGATFPIFMKIPVKKLENIVNSMKEFVQ